MTKYIWCYHEEIKRINSNGSLGIRLIVPYQQVLEIFVFGIKDTDITGHNYDVYVDFGYESGYGMKARLLDDRVIKNSDNVFIYPTTLDLATAKMWEPRILRLFGGDRFYIISTAHTQNQNTNIIIRGILENYSLPTIVYEDTTNNQRHALHTNEINGVIK